MKSTRSRQAPDIGSGADVSREGVQRDILPIVEGSVSQHQAWSGEDRSHPVYRSGCFPHGETDRSDPGTAGDASRSVSSWKIWTRKRLLRS